MVKLLNNKDGGFLCSRVTSLEQDVMCLKNTNKKLLATIDVLRDDIKYLQHLTRVPRVGRAKISDCKDCCFLCKHKRHVEGLAHIYYCKKKADVVGATKDGNCEYFVREED